jgi:hypothetical protein
MWVPRYIAVIWPAFAIILCALLIRLPSRPLRYFAIAVLLLTNVAQVFGRFNHGEPPIDHVIADLYGMPGDTTWSFSRRWAAWDEKSKPLAANGDSAPKPRNSAPNTLTFVDRGAGNAHPGGGTYGTRAGMYYLSIASGVPFTADAFMRPGRDTRVSITGVPNDRALASEVHANPAVERIIIWERFAADPKESRRPSTTGSEPPDSVLTALGPDWRRKSETIRTVYYHWNWSELYTMRRREYVKNPSPSTSPARW